MLVKHAGSTGVGGKTKTGYHRRAVGYPSRRSPKQMFTEADDHRNSWSPKELIMVEDGYSP